MKTKILICFCSIFFFCSLSSHAKNITLDASADLDGDGKQDAIHLSIEPTGEYVLQVNDASRSEKLPDPGSLCDEANFKMEIIDIDKTDGFKEIMIHMYSEIDSCMDDIYHFFWYSGTSVNLMWKLEHKWPDISGSGIVIVSEWREFWNKKDKYLLDHKTRTMVYVPQAFHYVGVEANVNQSIPIFQTTAGKQTVANLEKDSTCLILLYDVQSGWYLIKSGTGLVGWTREIQKLGLPYAG